MKLTTAYENKQNQGIDDCKHFLFSLKISVEWCFTPLLTVFRSYHGYRSHYSCLTWVSPVLCWALKCLAQRHPPQKKTTEDPVQLEPRTPGLRAKHFTTERRWTRKYLYPLYRSIGAMIHQHFVTSPTSSPNHFIPEIISPLPFSSVLVLHVCSFFQRNHFFQGLP